MKRSRLLAILLAVAAVFLTGLGGAMDFKRDGITKTHAWNDGHFLILFAIFMLLL
jgi:ABC-type glycerol-3-phosphate transport system substrate-binding protein